MQGRDRDTDIENRCVNMVREEVGGMNREIRIDIYVCVYIYIYIYTHTHTLLRVKYVASGNLLYSTGSS